MNSNDNELKSSNFESKIFHLSLLAFTDISWVKTLNKRYACIRKFNLNQNQKLLKNKNDVKIQVEKKVLINNCFKKQTPISINKKFDSLRNGNEKSIDEKTKKFDVPKLLPKFQFKKTIKKQKIQSKIIKRSNCNEKLNKPKTVSPSKIKSFNSKIIKPKKFSISPKNPTFKNEPSGKKNFNNFKSIISIKQSKYTHTLPISKIFSFSNEKDNSIYKSSSASHNQNLDENISEIKIEELIVDSQDTLSIETKNEQVKDDKMLFENSNSFSIVNYEQTQNLDDLSIEKAVDLGPELLFEVTIEEFEIDETTRIINNLNDKLELQNVELHNVNNLLLQKKSNVTVTEQLDLVKKKISKLKLKRPSTSINQENSKINQKVSSIGPKNVTKKVGFFESRKTIEKIESKPSGRTFKKYFKKIDHDNQITFKDQFKNIINNPNDILNKLKKEILEIDNLSVIRDLSDLKNIPISIKKSEFENGKKENSNASNLIPNERCLISKDENLSLGEPSHEFETFQSDFIETSHLEQNHKLLQFSKDFDLTEKKVENNFVFENGQKIYEKYQKSENKSDFFINVNKLDSNSIYCSIPKNEQSSKLEVLKSNSIGQIPQEKVSEQNIDIKMPLIIFDSKNQNLKETIQNSVSKSIEAKLEINKPILNEINKKKFIDEQNLDDYSSILKGQKSNEMSEITEIVDEENNIEQSSFISSILAQSNEELFVAKKSFQMFPIYSSNNKEIDLNKSIDYKNSNETLDYVNEIRDFNQVTKSLILSVSKNQILRENFEIVNLEENTKQIENLDKNEFFDYESPTKDHILVSSSTNNQENGNKWESLDKSKYEFVKSKNEIIETETPIQKLVQVKSSVEKSESEFPIVFPKKDCEISPVEKCLVVCEKNSNSDGNNKFSISFNEIENETEREEGSLEQMLGEINDFRELCEFTKIENLNDSGSESKFNSSFLNDIHSIHNELYENYFELDRVVESDLNFEDIIKNEDKNDQINIANYYHLIDKNDLDTDVNSNFRHSEIGGKIDLNIVSVCQTTNRFSLKSVSSINLVNRNSNEIVSKKSSTIKTKSLSTQTIDEIEKKALTKDKSFYEPFNVYCLLKLRIKHLLKKK